MKKIELTVYSIDELTDDAKERAHNEWISEFSPAWESEYQDSLKRFVAHFPIERYSSSFTPNYSRIPCDHQVDNMSPVRLATWLYNNYVKELYKGKYYSKQIGIKRDYKNCPIIGSNTISRTSVITKEISCPFTGFCSDIDLLEPILKFIDKPYKTDLSQLFYECKQAYDKAWESDVNGQMSMESFIDECESDEYQFLENGKRYC